MDTSALASGEIHLWLASYDEIGDDRLVERYRELLSSRERQQELLFHFLRDRRRFLFTRALVRTVLSRYAPIDPRDWLFSTNAYGRPEIANVTADELDLVFNVSHTDGVIALAVTARRAVGVDTEIVRARDRSLDIADRCFSPVEVRALAEVPGDRRQERFFEYWTFKESYIKARGRGLSLPLDKFSFYYPDDRSVCLSIEPELADDPARWQFWQFRPAADCLVALCAERRSDARADVVVRQVVPLRSERTIVLETCRSSPNMHRPTMRVLPAGSGC